MTDKQELLPCPFCGGLAKLAAPGFSNSKVTCAANYCCEALSVAAWNRRTPDPELAKVTAERDGAYGSLNIHRAFAETFRNERDNALAFVEKLQTALFFWLPSVTPEVDAETNGRVAEDAYLLVGMEGDISIAGWTDGLIERFRRSESLLASRTTAIGAAIEAMEPFAAFADLVAASRPGWSHDAFCIVSGRDISLTMEPFHRAGAVLAQLRSLIAGKETDVG